MDSEEMLARQRELMLRNESLQEELAYADEVLMNPLGAPAVIFGVFYIYSVITVS